MKLVLDLTPEEMDVFDAILINGTNAINANKRYSDKMSEQADDLVDKIEELIRKLNTH